MSADRTRALAVHVAVEQGDRTQLVEDGSCKEERRCVRRRVGNDTGSIERPVTSIAGRHAAILYDFSNASFACIRLRVKPE